MRVIFVACSVAIALAAMWLWREEESPSEERLGSGQMFDRIATRYDLTNRVLSLGLDVGWRKAMVDALSIQATDRVLDLATGTADVAILEGQGGAVVLGVDPSEQMLSVGRGKVSDANLAGKVTLQVGDATSLTLQNASFDKISIAFGIRNIPKLDLALSEMRRVAADGATLVIMEFCEPEQGVLAPVARLFIRYVVPRLGAFLSGAHWAEYRHLQESIAAFPTPTVFSTMIQAAGFRVDNIQYLGVGSVALYTATAT